MGRVNAAVVTIPDAAVRTGFQNPPSGTCCRGAL